MRRARSCCVTVLLFCAAAACGSPPEASSPVNETAPAPPASRAEVAPDAPPSADPPRRRKPFTITSACSEVVTVVLGENAKSSESRRTLAPSSTVDAPRDADGNQTVWLLDESGEPLVKVQVTRGMKRVEVGKSCRTLDAR